MTLAKLIMQMLSEGDRKVGLLSKREFGYGFVTESKCGWHWLFSRKYWETKITLVILGYANCFNGF